MPNWCNNTVEIRHDDPAMLERVRKGFAEGKLLQEFLPVPQDLIDTIAGSYGDDEKQALLEAKMEANIAKYGYANWYDWCVANWGTKWDVGGDDGMINELGTDFGKGLILTFDSAWAPPCDAYEKLVEMGFDITAYYYEGGMAFCGVWQNGVDDYYEIGGMNSTEVAEMLPPALDECMAISENIAMYEDEEQEEE